VLGLLGPNGAGKTTTVRILTTLLTPDSGRATVAGYDTVRDARQLRRLIGLSGQYAAVDENLTGRENLVMFGRLYHIGGAAARSRADELLERFDLTEAAGRPVKTYSGGMRRRLNLAGSLIVRPQVLFLDKPTIGLDPRGRIGMWDVIANLVREGATLLLTTQYLEEADRLANTIAVVDHGRMIASGTADELRARVGGERVEVVIHDRARLGEAIGAVCAACENETTSVDPHTRQIVVPTSGGSHVLVEVIRELDSRRIAIDDIALRRPTLDDVFLALTGHRAEAEAAAEEPVAVGGGVR
jgi:ABC-2 type transport system ATP-binding protein